MSGTTGRISDAPRVLIKNASGEEIPGRSFVRLTGGSDSEAGIPMVHGDKPNGESDALYVVSGPAPIADGEIGGGFYPSSFVWIKNSGTPSPVVEIGPVVDEWTASEDGSGFRCVRVEGDFSLAVALGGGGGGTGEAAGGCDNCGDAMVEVGAGTDCDGKAMPAALSTSGFGELLGLSEPIIMENVGACEYGTDEIEFTCPE